MMVPSFLKPPLRRLYWMYQDSFLGALRRRSEAERAERVWREQGAPAPPPHSIKEKIVLEYAKAYGISILIETGTYLGDMIRAMRPHFKKVISIELSAELAARATRRFSAHPEIGILQGDSGEILGDVLRPIAEPCLFWLDGHYSGGFTAQAALDTPVLAELIAIFAHPVDGHVMLIDDARLFDGTDDYPTLAELEELVRQHRPGYEMSVKNDAIRIGPARAGFVAEV